MLKEGMTFFWAKSIQKFAKISKKKAAVRSISRERQLHWEPDVDFGGICAVSYFSGLQCNMKNFVC